MSSREQYREYNIRLKKQLSESQLKVYKLKKAMIDLQDAAKQLKLTAFESNLAAKHYRETVTKLKKHTWDYVIVAFLVGVLSLFAIFYIMNKLSI